MAKYAITFLVEALIEDPSPILEAADMTVGDLMSSLEAYGVTARRVEDGTSPSVEEVKPVEPKPVEQPKQPEQPTAVAVILDNGLTVPLSEVNDHPHSYVKKVVWDDDSWAWGKSWAGWDGSKWIHLRIGAGAYGGLTVWRADRELENLCLEAMNKPGFSG
jgi:hypothetical protein